MIAPIDKIKSLLNEDIVALFGDDVLNNAYIESFKTTLALIADEYIIENLSNSGLERGQYFLTHTTDNNGDAVHLKNGFSDNRRILAVMRKNTAGSTADNIYYEAAKIPFSIGETQAQNINSIYYENDAWNPKYYFDTNGSMIILPKNKLVAGVRDAQAQVFFITFPDFGTAADENFRYTFELNGLNFSGISKENEEVLFYGLPGAAKELCYTQICLNLVNNYMADFVFDEEDTELVNLASQHATALTAKKQEELNYVMAKYSNQRAQ